MKKLIFALAAVAASAAFADGKIIRIYNGQSAVKAEILQAMVRQLGSGPRLPAEVVVGKPEDGNPFKGGKVGIAIIVEENEKCPVKMTCAPDDGIVRVNVAALRTDGADAKKIGFRCLKEMWRGLCFSCGSGYTLNPMCLLKPTDGSLKGLDALDSCCPAPDAFSNVIRGVAARGITPKDD